MEDLVQFLRDRCDEEALQAVEVADLFGDSWTVDAAMGSIRSSSGADVIDEPEAPLSFIARYDPARAAAEVAAKREILALHDAAHLAEVRNAVGIDSQDGAISALTATVRLLAVAYADHPDYREAWRP